MPHFTCPLASGLSVAIKQGRATVHFPELDAQLGSILSKLRLEFQSAMMQPRFRFTAMLAISPSLSPDPQRCVIALSLVAAAIWGAHRGRAGNYRAPNFYRDFVDLSAKLGGALPVYVASTLSPRFSIGSAVLVQLCDRILKVTQPFRAASGILVSAAVACTGSFFQSFGSGGGGGKIHLSVRDVISGL